MPPKTPKIKTKKDKPEPASQPFFSPKTKEAPKKITDEYLATLAPKEIMAMENYIDNNIQEIFFYEAQLAEIRYIDGQVLKLGLISEWMKEPIVAVNYRTLRDEYTYEADPGITGDLFFRQPGKRPAVTSENAKLSFKELMLKSSDQVQFKVDEKSGRIVPTVVNAITAPFLCTTLRGLEYEYITNFNMNIEMMEEFAILLSLYYGVITFKALSAAEGLGKKAINPAAAMTVYEEKFALKFTELLASKATGSIIVEGVEFAGIKVMEESGALVVRFGKILNVERYPGMGRMMHLYFESAARKLAMQTGKYGAKVQIYNVINRTYKNWIISLGYEVGEYITTANGITSTDWCLEKWVF
ncbi:MAG: hypothetical protein ACHQFW_09740 [Chitinophagales bacterium]